MPSCLVTVSWEWRRWCRNVDRFSEVPTSCAGLDWNKTINNTLYILPLLWCKRGVGAVLQLLPSKNKRNVKSPWKTSIELTLSEIVLPGKSTNWCPQSEIVLPGESSTSCSPLEIALPDESFTWCPHWREFCLKRAPPGVPIGDSTVWQGIYLMSPTEIILPAEGSPLMSPQEIVLPDESSTWCHNHH